MREDGVLLTRTKEGEEVVAKEQTAAVGRDKGFKSLLNAPAL